MKTFVLGLLLFFHFTLIYSYCQTPLKFGANLGISSANQNYNNISAARSGKFDSKPGFRFGLFGEYITSQNLSFMGEAAYMQNGTKDKNITVIRKANNALGYEEIGTLDLRYDYISLSALAKGRYEFSSLTPYVFAGPVLNYLVGGNEQSDQNRDMYNKFVLGYSAAIGTEINMQLPFILTAEFRYNHDLTNAFKDDYFTIKSYSFDFLVGVKF